MTVYFLTIAIVLVFCGLAQNQDYYHNGQISIDRIEHTSSTSWFFAISSIWLIVIAGTRYNVGTDFGAYYRNYEKFVTNLWVKFTHLNEPGFGVIAKIATTFHNTGTTVILLTSFITIGLAMRTIYKFTDCLQEAVLMYLFLGCWHESFNAVRQCLAIAVVFFGYKYIREGNLKKYVFLVFLGFLFHKSAVIMIAFYYFVRKKVDFRNIVVLVIGTVIILFSYDFLFRVQTEVFNDGIIQYSYVTTAVNILRVIVNVLPAIFFLIFRDSAKNEETDIYMDSLLLHAAFSVASSNSTYIARITMFTAPFACIAIPELFKSISPEIRRFIKPVFYVLFCAFWLYDISINSSLNSFTFIWNRVI